MKAVVIVDIVVEATKVYPGDSELVVFHLFFFIKKWAYLSKMDISNYIRNSDESI